jgi:hypothetical protein
MKTKKNLKIGVMYSSITVKYFSKRSIRNFADVKTGYEYKTRFTYDVDEDQGEIGMMSSTVLKNSETKQIYIRLKVLSVFKIENLQAAIVKNEDGSFDCSLLLLQNLSALGLGTVRGILHEKLNGSVLQRVPLSLSDIRTLENIQIV